MLSFVVFHGDRPASDRPLRHAHLLGADSVPASGDVWFEQGVIRCEKQSRETCSLSLQVDLDAGELRRALGRDSDGELARLLRPMGSITLHTCLLPERERPYLLSLELARHRILLFLTKLEEWQMFDLPAGSTEMRLFEAARGAFTAALVSQRASSNAGYTGVTDGLALRALWFAIEASERLALRHAAEGFTPRVTGELYERLVGSAATSNGRKLPALTSQQSGVVLPAKPTVGCAVSPAVFADPLKSALQGAVDFIQMPMRWSSIEPREGEYRFVETDRWIEWAVRKARLPVAAGPVLDFRAGAAPEWLYIWENDYETLRELVYEHVKSVVTRYRRTVDRWIVCSGLHRTDHFRLSFDQMMDLTRVCVLTTRKLQPSARIIVEFTEPWGEYYASNRRSLPPVLYGEMINQAGIAVDGFGLRVTMGGARVGQSTRDLMEFAAMLDRYSSLDRPLAVTGLAAPAAKTAGGEPHLAPGDWRGSWSPAVQAAWLSGYAGVALSMPYIDSVCWYELLDSPRHPELVQGGLLTGGGEPKPAMGRLRELHDALKAGTVPRRLTEAPGPGA